MKSLVFSVYCWLVYGQKTVVAYNLPAHHKGTLADKTQLFSGYWYKTESVTKQVA